MPSTRKTLFDAFAQAGDGSALDRALAGFDDPVSDGITARDSRGGSALDRALAQFETLQLGGGGFPQQAQTQGGDPFGFVPDILKTVLKDLASGEEFLNVPGLQAGTAIREALEQVPGVGGLLGQTFDIAASPLTLIPAFKGVQIAAALRGVPLIGRASQIFLEPIISSPNFLARLGAETAFGLMAEETGSFMADRVPENAPFPVQVTAGIFGALAGGLAGGFAFKGITDMATGIKVARTVKPTAVLADAKMLRATDVETDLLQETLGAYPDVADNVAREMKSVSMFATAEGSFGQQVAFAQETPAFKSSLDYWNKLTEASVKTQERVEESILTAYDNLDQETYTGLLTRVLPESVNRFIMNGWIGRTPGARTIATTFNNYARSQQMLVGQEAVFLRKMTDEMFGTNWERTSFKETAPGDLKKAWDVAAAQENHHALGAMVVEDRQFFNLNDSQLEWLDAYDFRLETDLELSRAWGVEVDQEVEFYARHAIEFFDADAASQGLDRTLSQADLASRTGLEVKESGALGRTAPFQMPRTYQRMRDLINAQGMDKDVLLRQLRGQLREATETLAKGKAKSEDFRGAIKAADDIKRFEKLIDSVENRDVAFRAKNANFEDTYSRRLIEGSRLRSERLAIQEAKQFGPEALADVERVMKTPNVGGLTQMLVDAAATMRAGILSLDFSTTFVQGFGAMTMGRGLGHGMEVFNRQSLSTAASAEKFAMWTAENADRVSKAQLDGLELGTTVLEIGEFADDIWERQFTRGFALEKAGKLAEKVGLGRQGRLFDFREDVILPTGKTAKAGGLPLSKGGKDINYIGKPIRTLNRIQFGRLVTMWKVEMHEHLTGMLKAGRNDADVEDFFRTLKPGNTDQAAQMSNIRNMAGAGLKDVDDGTITKASAEFVNDLLGGLNRVGQGRTVTQNLLESLFILTPGFTRGTLSVAANTFSSGPKGALARDFAARGFLLGAGIIMGLTTAINGIVTTVKGEPELVTANVTDPSKGDWMSIPLPNGKTLRPFSRFRSLGKLAFDSIDNTLREGPIEGAQRFTEDTLRWASYRQSALISTTTGDPIGALGQKVGLNTGNRFARGFSLGDIAFNPSVDTREDLADLAASVTPISLQTVREAIKNNGMSPGAVADASIALGAEFLGVTAFGPSLIERSVVVRGFDAAVGAGVPEDQATELMNSNRPPWQARDEQGKNILDRDTIGKIVTAIAADLGVDEEVVRRGGTRSARERKSSREALREAQISDFFSSLDAADDIYLNGAENRPGLRDLTAAVNDGRITHEVFSQQLTELRQERGVRKGEAERANPAAVAFLRQPSVLNNKNELDQTMDAISTEFNSVDFYDPRTLTFDFEAREAMLRRLDAKYGPMFDEWQGKQDARKQPLELDRDQAFQRMEPYFAIADDAWVRATGGLLGPSEKDFELDMRQTFQEQGMDEQTIAVAIQLMKRSMPGIQLANQMTRQLRDLMRLSDPQMEADVTLWLGNLPRS